MAGAEKKKKKRGWSERPAKAGGAQTGTRVGGGTLTAGWLGAHVEAEWRSTLWGKLGLALPSPKACISLIFTLMDIFTESCSLEWSRNVKDEPYTKACSVAGVCVRGKT